MPEGGGEHHPDNNPNDGQDEDADPGSHGDNQGAGDGIQEADRDPSTQVEWGPDTVQDSEMRTYGFLVNTKWKLAICVGCRSGISAESLWKHLNSHLKEFGLRVSQAYCSSIVGKYGLLTRNTLKSPTSIIPAIYGLPIRPNLQYCSECGYAARARSTMLRHKNEGCKDSKILHGPAQTFFPTPRGQCFFAVKIPQPKATKPAGPVSISSRFKAQFAPALFCDQLITIPSNNRDVNHFLSLGNWFQEVEGLTGSEAYDISRNSQSDLRSLVRQSMNTYISTMNEELLGEDFSVKVTMGDYNGWVLPQNMPLSYLFMSVLRVGWSTSRLERLVKGATSYSKLGADLITFCLGLVSGAFPKYTRPVPDDQRSAAKAYLRALEFSRANTQKLLQRFLYTLFTQPLAEDRYRSTAYRFLIVYSFRQEGNIDFCGTITQHISRMVFLGRCAIYQQIQKEMKSRGQGFFTYVVFHFL